MNIFIQTAHEYSSLSANHFAKNIQTNQAIANWKQTNECVKDRGNHTGAYVDVNAPYQNVALNIDVHPLVEFIYLT